jgi:hypothetical protein
LKNTTSKIVRRTFSLPPGVDAEIVEIRRKAARINKFINQSEVIRLGLMALDDLNQQQLEHLLRSLSRIKPGRKTA